MKYYDLWTENCLLFENKTVFVAGQLNMIYMLDLTSGEVKIVGSIPEEDLFEERLIGDIQYWNNQVIFVPLNAKKIWIYNMEHSEWHGIEFEKNVSPDCNYKFMGSYIYKNQLYMFGFGYPGIVIMNLDNNDVQYIDVVENESGQLKSDSDGCFWGMNYVIKDKMIYLASLRTNMVLKFNVETLEKEWVSIGNSSNRYIGIDWDGKYFWLAPRTNGNIVKWDGDNWIEEYLLPEGYEKDRFYFHGVCADNNKITLHSFSGKTLELSSEESCEFKFLEEKIKLYKKIDGMKTVKICEGIVWLYDKMLKVPREYECKINSFQLWEFLSVYFNTPSMVKPNTLSENDIIDLELFLKLLDQKERKNVDKDDKTIGNKICNKLLKTI